MNKIEAESQENLVPLSKNERDVQDQPAKGNNSNKFEGYSTPVGKVGDKSNE
jgi:hypothetical protein